MQRGDTVYVKDENVEEFTMHGNVLSVHNGFVNIDFGAHTCVLKETQLKVILYV
jgi:hypothetical protein